MENGFPLRLSKKSYFNQILFMDFKSGLYEKLIIIDYS